MVCKHCSGRCVKTGLRNGIQKLRCTNCRKYQQEHYRYPAYAVAVDRNLITLLKEGAGIRGISRILAISVGTVIRRIRRIANSMKSNCTNSTSGIFEIDEVWTYVGKKTNDVWITYSLERGTRNILALSVGGRTRNNLQMVVNSTLAMNPSRLCTDRLNTYRGLVPSNLHLVGLPHTRRIERFNLNLRTHLKRLSRKTICFSRSLTMLEACLKIYFWS
jgi:IS1 family transposase/transposase-like protein